MDYSTSHLSRRIVGRCDKGDRLPEALIALCRQEGIEAGQVRAEGILTGVELGLFSIDEEQYREVFAGKGAFELLSFRGILSMLGPELLLNAHVVVAYPGHGQSHVVGGQLRSATVYAVEFVIDVFEDVRLTRALDTETQLPLLRTESFEPVWSELAPEPPPAPVRVPVGQPPARAAQRPRPEPPPPPFVEPAMAGLIEPAPSRQPQEIASANDWARAARQSQEMLADVDDDIEWVELEPGDVLQHPRLGECIVLRVDDDTSAYIRIKKSRRISKLALSVVRLEQIDERDDGTRVFKVTAGT